MSTSQTILPGVHDPNLVNRRPIPQAAWTEAWRLATDSGKLEPQLRWPNAQVGTCRNGSDPRPTVDRTGCGGALVPLDPPTVVGLVRWFECVCTRCGDRKADAESLQRINPAAAAAVNDWKPEVVQ